MDKPNQVWQVCFLFFTTLTLPIAPLVAQNPLLQPDSDPLEIERLMSDTAPEQCFRNFADLAPGTVLTSQTICPASLTLPSLWWTKEQFEAKSPNYNKLVSDWLTYLPVPRQPGRVDLIVDAQRWSLMDYFSRYQFVNTFGSSAYGFGYNTRVFNLRGEILGAYTCNFAVSVQQGQAPYCQIQLESAGLRSPNDGLGF
jgi:hypothetical protein